MRQAWISAVAGVAIVAEKSVEGSVAYYRLGAETSAPPRECAPQQAMNLLNMAPDIEAIEPGPPPYKAARKALKQSWQEDRALTLSLMAVDRDLPADLRAESARLARKLLADAPTRTAVRNRLLSVPLPASADIGELPRGSILSRLFKEAVSSRSHITAAEEMWRNAAYELHSKGVIEIDAKFLELTLRPACIRRGGFAALVDSLRVEDSGILGKWMSGSAHEPPFSEGKAFLEHWQEQTHRLVSDMRNSKFSSLFIGWLSDVSWRPEEVEALLTRDPQSDTGQAPSRKTFLDLRDALYVEGDVATKLVDLARSLLERKPDLEKIGSAPNRLLRHLLLLCSEVRRDDRLLFEILALWFRRQPNMKQPMREALAAAIKTQLEYSELLRAWKGLRAKKPSGLLQEASQLSLGKTSKKPLQKSPPRTVGRALAMSVLILEDCNQRRQELRKLLAKISERWPATKCWNEEFIRLAHDQQFPRWAIETLPSLFVVLPESRSGARRLLLWQAFESFLRANKTGEWKRLRKLCNGFVLEVEVDKSIFHLLQEIAPSFEDLRKNLPYASDAAMDGVKLDAMAYLEQRPFHNIQAKKNKISAPKEVRLLRRAAKERRSQMLKKRHSLVRRPASRSSTASY